MNTFSFSYEFVIITHHTVRQPIGYRVMADVNRILSVKTLLLPLMMTIAGCAAQATAWTEKITTQKVELPTECAGWEKIEIKTRSRYYMMKEDQRALVDIDAHNLRGKNLGCWDKSPTD